MTRRGDAIAAKQSMINLLIFVVVVLACALMVSILALATSRNDFTVSLPPDMRNGAIVNVDEFNTSVVHAFASSTFATLNRWDNDGLVDYAERIEDLSPRFTRSFADYLIADMNFRNEEDELVDRVREINVLYDGGIEQAVQDSVEVIDNDNWLVTLKVRIKESIADWSVKNDVFVYTLIVRRGNTDPENRWGLLIDGYPEDRLPYLYTESVSSAE